MKYDEEFAIEQKGFSFAMVKEDEIEASFTDAKQRIYPQLIAFLKSNGFSLNLFITLVSIKQKRKCQNLTVCLPSIEMPLSVNKDRLMKLLERNYISSDTVNQHETFKMEQYNQLLKLLTDTVFKILSINNLKHLNT